MHKPLAHRIRPTNLSEVYGQEHIIGNNGIIRQFIDKNRIFSLIFYGPPGTGKTTLAQVIANELNINYRMFNAVTGNKKDLDIIFMEAKMYDGLVLIIDEVHRLNKDKQDLLLPHIENGDLILIGATTANPYHSINPAIRSRCHLLEVKQLSVNDIIKALRNALVHEKGLNNEYTIAEKALLKIASNSNGDIRYALNLLELCSIASTDKHISEKTVLEYSSFSSNLMDNDGDGYYDILSAFQKSIRGGDVNAALYYLSVLINCNDFESIERRLLVTAYEDIGLGNPAAVSRCINAIDAARRVGFPEGRIPLSLAIIDLCLSPKSKSAEAAIDRAMQVSASYHLPVLRL